MQQQPKLVKQSFNQMLNLSISMFQATMICQAGLALGTILDNIDGVSHEVMAIADESKMILPLSQEIAHAIETVSNVSREHTESTEEMAANSFYVSEVVTGLIKPQETDSEISSAKIIKQVSDIVQSVNCDLAAVGIILK